MQFQSASRLTRPCLRGSKRLIKDRYLLEEDVVEITDMVEKPAPGTQPSNFFINGRYILQPEIFNILETQERGAGNEIQLTDGMLKLLKQQQFTAYHYKGVTYDTEPGCG